MFEGLGCRRVRRSEVGGGGRRGVGGGDGRRGCGLWGRPAEGVVSGKSTCILCINFIAYTVQYKDGVGLYLL
jgi:hypothetical protein